MSIIIYQTHYTVNRTATEAVHKTITFNENTQQNRYHLSNSASLTESTPNLQNDRIHEIIRI